MSEYAIYLRKSRADLEAEAHGEGETLLRHEKMLTETARKMNLPVTDVYREIVSGETIDARPQIQKLLRETEKGRYSGVLVVDVDRLARGDTVDQGIIARTFRLSGTKIITPKKVYDPNSEFDEEYFEFELFMARREYKIISRRIQRGRIASVNDGKFIGSTPPFGYDKVKLKNDKGYTLEPNSEAETVRLIFKLSIDGSGASVIANTLNDMDIKTRSGGSWSKSTVSDILSNPVYIGKIRWSYRPDVKSVENGVIHKRRTTNEDCIIVNGLHKPIVSEEDFERARKMTVLNRKAPVKSSTVLQNPLSGLIYCRKCGSKMTRLGMNKRNKYDTIKCPNRHCDCVSAPIYLVEELLLEGLKKWLKCHTVNAGNSTDNQTINTVDIKNRRIQELQAEISAAEKQIAHTYDLLEQGVYTTEIFVQRNRVLSERTKKAAGEIARLQDEIKNIENARLLKNQIIPRVENIIASYDSCKSAVEKNALLKSILTRIEYEKTAPNRRGHADNPNFSLTLYTTIADEIVI